MVREVQRIYFTLQSFGRTYPFNNLPGSGTALWILLGCRKRRSLHRWSTPSQAAAVVKLPRLHRLQPALTRGRIQFRDSGFEPKLATDELRLGPEQLAVVGYGEYGAAKYDLGVQEDVVIPRNIRRVEAAFHQDGTNALIASLTSPARGDLRILMRQSAEGKPVRSSRGAPPNGISLDKILQIQVFQENHPVPVQIEHDKAIWSGLSWAVGEVTARDLKGGVPIRVRCVSLESRQVELNVELYVVSY